MRAFLTGASGFLGRALAERFESRGVDLHSDPSHHVAAGNVSEPGEWQDHAQGCELFLHTAASVSMRNGMDPFWRANVLGTRRALDAAVAARAERFVHFSSVVTFSFDFPDDVDETWPVRPNGVPYVDTKIASEQVVLAAHAAGEIPCTVLRPADVYGPGSRPWTLIPLAELQARRLILPAMGKGIFSPIYVDDLVDGIVAAASSEAGAGQVFTLAGGGVTTADYFGRLARMIGRKGVPAAPTPVVAALAGTTGLALRAAGRNSELAAGAVRYLARSGTYSAAKAERMLGWRAKVGLDEGMRRTEAWLRSEGLI